jgi:hypothetical protein
MSGVIATAVAFASFSLLFGKPVRPKTAICFECTTTGILSGRPMDAKMAEAARLNGIDMILLARYDDYDNDSPGLWCPWS